MKQVIAAFFMLVIPLIFAFSQNLETIQYSFRSIAKKILPVVVEINITEKKDNSVSTNPFEQPDNQAPSQQIQALGSGVIVKRINDTYYVLTNNHVVGNASTITIKLQDQTIFYRVKLVGKDERRDLAVVSFTSSANLPIANLGDSDDLEVGDIVLAVGNPLGFESTVTMGIISALGRNGPSKDVATNTDYIQTDAAINQGNSGGALVNIKGEVIGINTWIAAPSGGNIGLGFAVPINNAKKVINDFITKGKAEYGWLGVQTVDVNNEAYPGVLKDLQINVKGAMLLAIYRGQPGDKSGLLPGDFVIRINNQDITGVSKFIQVVGDLLADRPYDFEFIRNGEYMKLTVRLSIRPNEESDTLSYKNLWPGLTVIHVNDQIRETLNDSNIPQVDGVMVGYVAVGNTPDDISPAALAGLKTYDIIRQINGHDIHTVMDFYKAINDKTRKDLICLITRQGVDVSIRLAR